MTDARLRQVFKEHLPDFDIQSVETWGTGRGVPDMNFCYNGVEGWVEFKRTKHWKVNVAPEQVAWIERRLRAGGSVLIAVRRIQPATVDDLYLLHGSQARALAMGERPSTINALGVWSGGPARWNWQEIKALLLR